MPAPFQPQAPRHAAGPALLEVAHLTVRFGSPAGEVRAVEDFFITVGAGESVGIIGESGSGKTVACMSMTWLLPSPPACYLSGRIVFKGEELQRRDEAQLRAARGRGIGMIFQNAWLSFDPAYRLGRQIAEMLRVHFRATWREMQPQVVQTLRYCNVAEPEAILQKYPHEVSGGVAQRVNIALALLIRPDLLIADEPTTALDLLSQIEVLALLERLREETGLSLVLVSHDLSVVRRIADRVIIMYAGRIVEEGPTGAIFAAPRHPYTQGLLASALQRSDGERIYELPGTPPDLAACRRGAASARAASSPSTAAARCPASRRSAADTGHAATCLNGRRKMASGALLAFDQVSVVFRKRGTRSAATTALDRVSFAVTPGGSVGAIGDSGAGKSTLCRVAAGLVRPLSGRIVVDGTDLTKASQRDWQQARRHVGLVFQDALGSFNPMRPVEDGIAMPLVSYADLTRAELRRAVGVAMEQVGLQPSQMTRYPHEFSGGQIQRLAIARVLTTHPRLLVLDEPVSALDVSIRAQILNLLIDLGRALSLTYLVISSDPAVVRYLTTTTLVLFAGRIIEVSPTLAMFTRPLHPYTVSLPALRDPEMALRDDGLSGSRSQAEAVRAEAVQAAPRGCRFAGVCPLELPCCHFEAPDLVAIGDQRAVRCHSRAAVT